MTALLVFALLALAVFVAVVTLRVLRSGRRQDERMAALGVRKAIEREEKNYETPR